MSHVPTVRPPLTVSQRRLGMARLVTPSSPLGARVIGLFGVLGSAFDFAWAAIFAGVWVG